MTRVLVRPAAAAELDEAYRWYERERAGLGDEFLQAARSMLELIGNNPLAFPLVHRDRAPCSPAAIPLQPHLSHHRIRRFRPRLFPRETESKGVAHSQMRANKALKLTKHRAGKVARRFGRRRAVSLGEEGDAQTTRS